MTVCCAAPAPYTLHTFHRCRITCIRKVRATSITPLLDLKQPPARTSATVRTVTCSFMKYPSASSPQTFVIIDGWHSLEKYTLSIIIKDCVYLYYLYFPYKKLNCMTYSYIPGTRGTVKI